MPSKKFIAIHTAGQGEAPSAAVACKVSQIGYDASFTTTPEPGGCPTTKEIRMSIARVTEIISSSKKSFEDATEKGIERACQTLDGVKGAWVKDQKVEVEKGKITSYRVTLMVTFVLKD
jgi:flavin-binding protein dodecin